MPEDIYSPLSTYGVNDVYTNRWATPSIARFNNLQNLGTIRGGRAAGGRPSISLVGRTPVLPVRPVRERRRFNLNGVTTNLSKLAPYASNIVNAFRSAPLPQAPQLETVSGEVSPIRLDAARNDIARTVRGINRGITQTTQGQTGDAIQAANLATSLDAYGRVAQAEAQQNQQIRMFNAQQNQAVSARNVERMNSYNDQILARNIAQQRAQSENLANLTDKVVMDQTRKDMLALDKEKFDIISRMYTPGLLGRVGQGLIVPGTEDQYIRKNGGVLPRYKSIKSVR